ncbi:MAG: hypothetical protein MN733_12620 [Nitrososphaera sp.]|nr:hypothetical protein [Nitrososphaera sp.]
MKDLKQNLLRWNQRELLKSDIEGYDRSLADAKGPDRAVLLNRKRRSEQQLATQSPESLTSQEKDKLHALEKKLRNRIVENMPTEEVMRKNPPGAVDWNRRWLEANKKIISIWKNVRIQLNPDSQDRDLANIERYRPAGAVDKLRTDAQISGHMSYGNIDESEWPFEAPQNTALKQAERVYNEQTAEEAVEAAFKESEVANAEVQTKAGFGPSGTLTFEEYSALQERLAKGREVLKAKREAMRTVDEQEPFVDDKVVE